MRHRSVKSLSGTALVAAVILALTLGLTGCGPAGETQDETNEAQVLAVSAASSLKAVMTDLAAAFDAENGCITAFNFEPSGTLQQQIEAGAPVDVFASAAMKQANALKDKGLVDADSLQVFAGNEIVLVVPAGSILGISSFEDLTKPAVTKISYGDPAAAPHGVAAEEILNTLGLFDQVRPKVIYAANVTQALEYVTSGEVDAAIIFSTEAAIAGGKVDIVATSEPAWHGKIVYPAVVVSSSTNKSLAQAFVDFLVSSEGQAILRQHGFMPAPADIAIPGDPPAPAGS